MKGHRLSSPTDTLLKRQSGPRLSSTTFHWAKHLFMSGQTGQASNRFSFLQLQSDEYREWGRDSWRTGWGQFRSQESPVTQAPAWKWASWELRTFNETGAAQIEQWWGRVTHWTYVFKASVLNPALQHLGMQCLCGQNGCSLCCLAHYVICCTKSSEKIEGQWPPQNKLSRNTIHSVLMQTWTFFIIWFLQST